MSQHSVEGKDPVLLSPDSLHRFTVLVFERLGMPTDEATLLADHLVWADVRGIPWVGVKKIPQICQRLREGGTKAVADAVVVHERAGFALVDGADAWAAIAGTRAMDMAIERARGAGIGLVVVRNTTSANAMGYFAMRAVAERMIGMVINNSPPLMAPPGGKTGVLGTQAFAVAAPADKHDPLLLDMANSVTTWARIYDYLQRGEELPEGTALTVTGEPTVDPAAALGGLFVPMGDHRGYGLALMWEVLTGVLAGGPRFAGNVTTPDIYDQPQGVSMLLLAIDPEVAMPYDTFVARVDQLIDQMHACDTVDGVDRVTVPGERSHAAARAHQRDGVPVPRDLLQQLESIGSELGVNGPVVSSMSSSVIS